MNTVHLEHKYGGSITSIDAVGHATNDGVAYWFYRGNVEWKDGGKSVGTEIPPWAVCFDHDIPEAHAEYGTVSERLNGYLGEHGKWHDTKFKKGYAVSWTPKKKEFSVAV